MFRQRFFLTISVLVASILPSAHGQLSKAAQIFANRGIEVQGMVQYADIFNLSTYSNANYTSVNWLGISYQALLGPAPGFPWGRWVSSISNMPPQDMETDEGFTVESATMSQLINLELGDELNLSDGPTRTNEINWFNAVLPSFTNTILYINNYAGQASDQALSEMITLGHVDLICFDEYPFLANYDTNYPGNIGASNTWPFTSWFSELWRYRQTGINYSIPFGTYMQTFHSVEDYDQRVYRNPSASELRFNNMAALAFNAKMLIGFEYNAGATSLFNILPNGYSGDTYTNALYAEQADINHRAVILGRTLALLKPIHDLHNPLDTNPPAGPASTNTNFPDGLTTSMLILKGNPGTTTNTGEPIGFEDNPSTSKSYSWWEYQKNDPYLSSWTVANLGTNNGGSPGQVLISWFTPIDENFDGPGYTNEIYIMVVNALTSTNGASADCKQQITLDFMTGSGPTAVNMLDLETGLVSTNTIPVVGRTSTRQLVLTLNGGDAALFKFADGAPFVGHVSPGVPQLSAQMQGGLPAITIQGTPLARYELQSSPSLDTPIWSAVGYRLLTNSSAAIVDTFGTNLGSLYYRAVGIP